MKSSNQNQSSTGVAISTQKLVGALIACSMLLTALALVSAVYNVTLKFDDAVLEFIHTFASPQIDVVVPYVTRAGGALVVAVVTALLIAGLAGKRRLRTASLVAITIGGSAAATAAVKLLIERIRPDLWPRTVVENSFSFPSGHATASMAIGLSFILLTWHTRWRTTVLIFSSLYVIVIALTRLYLGVHYPTDIIGGWLMAALWFIAALLMTQRTTLKLVK